MLTALLLVSLAQLSSEDEGKRLEAAGAWAKKNRPQLSAKAAREVKDCIELPPVKDSGCDTPAKLCRLNEGDEGSGGTRIESVSFFLAGRESRPLRLLWSATYEPQFKDCDPPDHLLGHETPEERERELANWHQKHAKEYAACKARLTKKALDDAEEASCDAVLVNACRAEAFVICKTKNLRKNISALEHLHRFAF
ncbi:MAG: hypothetical protein ACO1OB_26135 [Archangium sp.]